MQTEQITGGLAVAARILRGGADVADFDLKKMTTNDIRFPHFGQDGSDIIQDCTRPRGSGIAPPKRYIL